MEVDSASGDNKCEIRTKRPKSKPKSVAMLSQSVKVLNCGDVGKCSKECEEGNQMDDAMSSDQAGTGVHREKFSKPFNFVRGRGKYKKLGSVHMNCSSGVNKHVQSSVSNSNVWGTSSLLDALQGCKAGSDDEKLTCASGALGDVKTERD
jgi:hypothetical protein